MLGPVSIQGKGSLAQVTEEWDGRRGGEVYRAS